MRFILTALFVMLAGRAMADAGPAWNGGPLPSNMAVDASLGLVPGYRTENKFGETDNADSGVATDIYDGSTIEIVALGGTVVWVPPTEARIHAVVSNSLADSDSGGENAQSTGMRTLEVTGLETWDSTSPTTETVILDGTTAVNTGNSYVIIYRMSGMTWGSGGLNAGSIRATATGDGTVTAAIVIGNNQTQMNIYGISSTMKLRMTDIHTSLVKTAGGTLRATGEILFMPDPATNAVNNTAWVNKQSFEVSTDARWEQMYSPPKKFDGPGIIKIQMTSGTNNTNAIASFDGVIKDD